MERSPGPAAGQHELSDLTVVIVPLYASYSAWMGGANYVANMVAALSEMTSDYLQLWVFDDRDGEWPEHIQTACRSAAVAGVIGTGGRILHGAPALAAVPPDQRRRQLALKAAAILPMPFAHYKALKTPRHWAWIPDFQHHHLPHLFASGDLAFRGAAFSEIARREGPLLLSSQDAAADLRRLYPSHRCRVHIWPFASSIVPNQGLTPEEVRARFDLPDRFLYVANQFWVHKDHRTLFRALAQLPAHGPVPMVICTGSCHDPRNPGHFERLFAEVAELGLSERVRYLGLVEQTEQIGLMRACTAVVQPSLFEGWSTVIEEALAIGAPVIAANLAVNREQLGPAGCFFRAGDAVDLARVLAHRLRELPSCPIPQREALATMNGRIRRQERAGHLLHCLKREAETRR